MTWAWGEAQSGTHGGPPPPSGRSSAPLPPPRSPFPPRSARHPDLSAPPHPAGHVVRDRNPQRVRFALARPAPQQPDHPPFPRLRVGPPARPPPLEIDRRGRPPPPPPPPLPHLLSVARPRR